VRVSNIMPALSKKDDLLSNDGILFAADIDGLRGANFMSVNVQPRRTVLVEDASCDFRMHTSVRGSGAVHDSAKRNVPPLVVLIGFLGASEKVMVSMAKKYEEALGYDTGWTIPPANIVFSLTDAPRVAFARALVNAISGLGEGGIVLAPFSNAGGFILRFLHALLTNPDADANSRLTLSRIAGIVYDSTPCLVTSPLPGARALVVASSPVSDGTLAFWWKYWSALMLSTIVGLSNLAKTGGSIDGE
jgi:Eukaryotic protein of unknown function (DUF829)